MTAQTGGSTTLPQPGQEDSDFIADPRRAQELIEESNTKASRLFAKDTQSIYIVWGIAWLLGYLCLALSSWNRKGEPASWAYLLYALALSCGVIYSIYIGIRAGEGWRGTARVKGMLYGWSWPLAFVFGMTICTVIVLQLGVPNGKIATVYNCLAAFIVGLEYMAGSILETIDLPMFIAGVCMLILSLLILELNSFTGLLVMAFLGGGSFLLLAVITSVGSARANKPNAD